MKKSIIAFFIAASYCISFAHADQVIFINGETTGVSNIELVKRNGQTVKGLMKVTMENGDIYYHADYSTPNSSSQGNRYDLILNGQMPEAVSLFPGEFDHSIRDKVQAEVDFANKYNGYVLESGLIKSLEAVDKHIATQFSEQSVKINDIQNDTDAANRKANNTILGLQETNWSEVAGTDSLRSELNTDLTAANAKLMAKLEAMEAKIAELESRPTNPAPEVSASQIQQLAERINEDYTAKMEAMHNHYEKKITALEERPTFTPNPAHAEAIRNSYVSDMTALHADLVQRIDNQNPVTPPAEGSLTQEQVQDMIDSTIAGSSMLQSKDWSAEIEEAKGGVAQAIAIASMPQAVDSHTTAVSAGLGHFSGQNAVSVGMSHRYERVTINGSLATDAETFSVGAGIGYSW